MINLAIKLFIKNYKDTANPVVRERYGKFASIVGIATNLLLFAIKIAVGLFFQSISITADAVNNLSDSGSSLITLLGFKISGKPADEEHPYGHARMEYISGLIISFIILFLGLQLIQSSIDKIIHPQTPEFSILAIAVLIVAILLKLWQCLFYRKIGKLIDSTTLLATSSDSRNDVLSTSVVLASVLITRLTGYNLDGYMGVVVALFILLSGIKLIKETTNPLLGLAPKKELVAEIYEKIMSYDSIIGLHDLSVHNYGAGKCFASVHCEVPAEQDIMVSHDIIDNIERDFLRQQDIHLVIHLDPVVTSDAKTNEAKDAVKKIVAGVSPRISMHDFRAVWGVSHSNLIFDIVVPYGLKLRDNEIIERISEEISKIDPAYYSVITIDHDYVPNKENN